MCGCWWATRLSLSLYGDAWTSLHIGPDRNEPVKVSWGVRQGNPLSVYLFNATIDWALDSLDPELGAMLGETRVNAGAIADNIALIARTSGASSTCLPTLLLSSGSVVWMVRWLCCGLTLMARGKCGLSTHTPICRYLGNRYLQLTSQVSNDTWGFLSLR